MENTESAHNEKGPIAKLYSDLQSIPILEMAKMNFPVKKATNLSATKAVLQAIEIALLNLCDLSGRITEDLKKSDIKNAVQKAKWLRDINRIILPLTSPEHFDVENATYKRIRSEVIRNLTHYFDRVKIFDQELSNYLLRESIDVEGLIESTPSSDNLVNLIYTVRVINHETVVWEKYMDQLTLPAEIENYEAFVGLEFLEKAVYDVRLEGDTFFTQFRALHQIPEILTAELNDHLEAAAHEIMRHNLEQAIVHLQYADHFSRVVLTSLTPITDNLTVNDYHKIRENLGLTSGSHSVNIHYHLFRDLYSAVAKSFMELIFISENNYLHVYSENFLVRLLESFLFKISDFTFLWRDLHLHFPRNNVGGNFTKSLVGSVDAVEAARKMRNAAASNDPLFPLRKLRHKDLPSADMAFNSYLGSDESMDTYFSTHIGNITKKKFENVQNRTGTFAQKVVFVPPPKRKI